MQVIPVLDNLNISPSLHSLTFMKGFSFAKSFLLHLKSLKQYQPIDKKPQNSLAFSPIAQHSSISDQNTNRQLGRDNLITQRDSRRYLQYDRKDNKYNISQNIQTKQVGIEYLKNRINVDAKHLNQMHGQLVYIEKGVEVLAEKLMYNQRVFKRIDGLKGEERDKNIRLIALKSAVDRKRMILQELQKNEDKLYEVLRVEIKNHLIDQNQNFSVEPVLSFVSDFIVREEQELEQTEDKEYPERLELKWKMVRKREKEREKEKEKKREEILTQQFIKEREKEKERNLNKVLEMDEDVYYDSEFIDS